MWYSYKQNPQPYALVVLLVYSLFNDVFLWKFYMYLNTVVARQSCRQHAKLGTKLPITISSLSQKKLFDKKQN